MMDTLAYRPDAEEVVERLRLLYERRAGDRIFAEMQVPSRALGQFAEENEPGYRDYPDPRQRILGRYDGGVLHIHGNGRHLLEAACSVKGVKAIEMGDDQGFPPAMDVVDELRTRAGEMPLTVLADFARFTDALDRHALPGGILYYVSDVPDVDTANRCMEKIRAYRV